MHIREFAFATSQAVTEFASRATRAQTVGNGAGEAHAYLIRIDAGGAIGAHRAEFGQLFVPLEGSAWVSGVDGVRQSVRPGQIACIEVGEMHSKGSEGGLTALMVQVRAFAFEGLRPARKIPVAGNVENELRAVVDAWDGAMVQNDARAIGRFMADEWTIIGPDGSCSDKARFLGLIESGALTHDVMQSEDVTVRVYGDAAVVVAHGVSGGMYRGQPFREVERQSNVFIRQGAEWKCVLTHLSRLPTSPT